MLNYNLFKTGVLCFLPLAFVTCTQGAKGAYLSTLQREHNTYLQQFQQSADTLQKRTAQLKANLNGAADTTLVQKIEAFDKKIGVYKEKYTQKLDRFQRLTKKFELDSIPQAEMATYETQYVADFKVYEDAFSQLKTYLDGLSVEAGKKH